MAAVRGLRDLQSWSWIIGNAGLISLPELNRLGIDKSWAALRPYKDDCSVEEWFYLDLKDFLLWWAENVDKDEAATELLRMEKTG